MKEYHVGRKGHVVCLKAAIATEEKAAKLETWTRLNRHEHIVA